MKSECDVLGVTFNNWVVIGPIEKKNKNVWCHVKCKCGFEAVRVLNDIRKGKSKSCGKCGVNKKVTEEITSTYRTWASMKQRCLNPKNARFEDYGGRGIGICEEWLVFEVFLNDMGKRPSKKHSLDRIDNERGYEPGNCKWSNDYEQQMNTRTQSNNKLGVKGVYFCERRGKYIAKMNFKGKEVLHKSFNNLEDARRARLEMEKFCKGQL